MSKDAPNRNEPGKNYSRRRFMRLAILGAAVVPAGSSLLAACGSATATPATAPTKAATSAVTGATATSATTSSAVNVATTAAVNSTNILKSPLAGVPDGYLAPPTPFKATNAIPGKGGTTKVYVIAYAAPPPPRNENKYWQELEKRLGVSWDVTLSPQNTYAEKLGVLTASGDLPDLTFVELGFAPEQQKLIQQGAYTDLTPFLTGDSLKEFPNLAAYPPQLWKNVAIKGKIYGIPRPRFLSGSATLWRKDWAEKMGNPNPKNAEELYKLMQDFSTKKLEESQSKTWAMGFTQGEFAQQALFMYMFRVPHNWKLDASGNLTYYIESPEYKEAVAFMRRLWEAGFIYPDSATQSKQQTVDNFVAGKFGFMQDSIPGLAGPAGRRATAQKLNPKADVYPFIPPGHDGGKATTWLSGGYFGMAAIPSKIGKDKERVKELLGIVNYLAAPFGSEEYNFLNFGIDGVHNEVKADGTRVLNDLGKKEISELPKISNAPQVLYYPGYDDQAKIMQEGIRQYVEVAIPYPITGAVSNTLNSKGNELNQLVEDRIVRIVVGRDPVSALDDLIKEWKSRGGSQVAQELAASFKA